MKRIGLLLVLVLIGMPAGAFADNTACTGAIFITPDGSLHSGTIAAGGTELRWYTFVARANRSYAITVENMGPSDAGNNHVGVYTLQSDCIGTALVTDMVSSGEDEPVNSTPTIGGDRRSLMTTADTAVYFSVGPELVDSPFRIHVEETTLFSNWFFVGGEYSAFTLLRNTTSSTSGSNGLFYRINWRNSAGTIVASESGVLPPNGSVYKNGRDYPGVLAAVSGTVEILHLGPADAIVASTTVMSPSTGLSFDAPFSRRVGR
jgi:hypothetical protein